MGVGARSWTSGFGGKPAQGPVKRGEVAHRGSWGGAGEGNIGTFSFLKGDKSRPWPVDDAITSVFNEALCYYHNFSH